MSEFKNVIYSRLSKRNTLFTVDYQFLYVLHYDFIREVNFQTSYFPICYSLIISSHLHYFWSLTFTPQPIHYHNLASLYKISCIGGSEILKPLCKKSAIMDSFYKQTCIGESRNQNSLYCKFSRVAQECQKFLTF